MTRLLPHPLLSLALVLMWLLLTSFSLGHLALGAMISVLAGLAFSRIEPQASRIRAWWPLVRLAGTVAVDIARSNLAVAAYLIFGRNRPRRSAVVAIPLHLRDPVALALLALIVTATPGTAWLDYDAGTGTLHIHVFDLVDEEEWRVLIRTRYEAPLLEAFA